MSSKTTKINITGQVQGVGFRPHVFRLASEFGLNGFIKNSVSGVEIEVYGGAGQVENFISTLKTSPPPRSIIEKFLISDIPTKQYSDFTILHSDEKPGVSSGSVFVSADISVCADCAADITNPENRRRDYAFTNCTNCGPRYTITEDLPYDRPYTTMKKFPMCKRCLAEYENPMDRRFHAQPNACAECGPGLYLIEDLSKKIDMDELSYSKDQAGLIKKFAAMIRDGKIGALMGIGGFHIAARSDDDPTVIKLRERKNRPSKPFALMAPSVEFIKEICFVSKDEEALLRSHIAPIVLLRKKENTGKNYKISEHIAPQNNYLGFMLPYSPLHILLMKEYNAPMILTSGNLSDEPICYRLKDASEKLSGICDIALCHNRDILLPCDDSVMFVENGRNFTIRPSRGIAPNVISLGTIVQKDRERKNINAQSDKFNSSDEALNEEIIQGLDQSANAAPEKVSSKDPQPKENKNNNIFAVGGILKNTLSFNLEDRIVTSQYIGDTDIVENFELFETTVDHFKNLYKIAPEKFIHDMNPDARTSKYSGETPAKHKPEAVQHHYAHILSVMAENKLAKKVLGLAFDGTGFGTDGTVWGGEFLVCDAHKFERAGYFKPFTAHNYDGAVKTVSKLALSAIYGMCGKKESGKIMKNIGEKESSIIFKALEAGVNTVKTSSLGRIFDVAAVMAGFEGKVSFEGEAAIFLEMNFPRGRSEFWRDENTDDCYNIDITEYNRTVILDWKKMLEEMIKDAGEGAEAAEISYKFHKGVVISSFKAGKKIAELNKILDICLSGGVFYNRVILSNLISMFERSGFTVHTPKYVSMGDSGISAGQCYFGLMN